MTNNDAVGDTRTVYSHPTAWDDGRVVDGTPLVDHAETVAERCEAAVPSDESHGRLSTVARVVGWLHDLGKATPWFQTGLREESEPDGPTHHARLGSLAVYYTLRELGFGATTRLAGLHTVAKHHGSLKKATDYVERQFIPTRYERPWSDGRTGDAVKQAEIIDDHTRQIARHLFDGASDGCVSWDRFVEWVRTHPAGDFRELRDSDISKTRPLDGETGGLYTETLLLWGALSFADITAASGVTDDDDRLAPAFDDTDLSPERVRAYAAAQGDDEATGLTAALNTVRTKTQRAVAERAEAVRDTDARTFTLTLPTGYGKTVAGTLAATHLRESSGRVVYALPFTSIVDQTASVLEDEAFLDTDATGSLLTVHHHLSETVTTGEVDGSDDPDEFGGEDTDEGARQAELLAEAWRSETTLTTFVQLFESLAAPDRTQSLKLPALDGSVVVLDEPQALPLGWWPLVRALARILTAEYDARVVSMTATQPSLFSEAEPLLPKERLEEIERSAFGSDPPDRVVYEFHETALGTTPSETYDYTDAAADAVEATHDGPSLCVCNTIDSAERLSEQVTEQADVFDVAAAYTGYLSGVGHVTADETDGEHPAASLVSDIEVAQADERLPLIHLSTRLRPVDRSFLVDLVSTLTDRGVPSLVVSTQLIEAGVDVSFDRVFRDFAPLDSIVQAAGRCNRSFDGGDDRGRVTVWRLPASGEEGMPPSEAVYARATERSELNTLNQTRIALREADVDPPESVSERDTARGAVETYHGNVGERVDASASEDDLVEAVGDGDFCRLADERLVGTDLSFEVYVCRTDTEHTLVESLRTAHRQREWDRVEELTDRLAPIRVSVPVYRPESEAAETLRDLPRLDPQLERDDVVATERVLDARVGRRHADGFDDRIGLQYENLGVDGRFL